MEDFKTKKAEIENLIAEGEIEQAIDILLEWLEEAGSKNAKYKTLATLGKLRVAIKKMHKGTISENLSLESYDKAIDAIIKIMKGLERNDDVLVIKGLEILGVLLLGSIFIGSELGSDKFSSFTDLRDGKTYKTVKLLGKTWLAENLNFDAGKGCWFYDNNLKNGKKYGRLYTWEAAKKACPPGWRLPTDEEWQAFAMHFGGCYDGENGKKIGDPQKAYQALIKDGDSGFAALLGGHCHIFGSFLALSALGFYWSATERGGGDAYYYEFGSDGQSLYRVYCDQGFGFSVRCLQI
jgi:uncharacterized protein (TIGR02145 family)